MSSTDDEEDEHLSAIAQQLRHLEYGNVVFVGHVPAHSVGNWLDCATTGAIVTWGARNHYASRHPEVMEFEQTIVAAILDPDEVQVDPAYPRTNSLFKEIDDRYDIVVSLWISDNRALMNSVKSARKQRRGNDARAEITDGECGEGDRLAGLSPPHSLTPDKGLIRP